MSDYVITTDSGADLPREYLEEHQLKIASLTCLMDGESYNDEHPISDKDFYAKIRGGSMPTTSQVSPEQARELFEPFLKEGKDVLHLAFDSGISGSYQSEEAAAKELREEYPERKLIVIDTLCASMGQGLLVHKALQMKEAGASLEEVVSWCEDNKMGMATYVVVDDLNHLYRGGRVSRSSAVLGSVVGIKPIIRIDEKGELEVCGKIRGRRKAIQHIIDQIMERIRDDEKIVSISHGDCLEDAEAMKKILMEQYGIEEVLISFVGPVIGSHTGPGVLVLSAMSKSR
ncbi:MAG: DegV family protein [Lachnospiraceae bacterium]|nr:DegV family protein [Lachnospiraceae bacterium]